MNFKKFRLSGALLAAGVMAAFAFSAATSAQAAVITSFDAVADFGQPGPWSYGSSFDPTNAAGFTAFAPYVPGSGAALDPNISGYGNTSTNPYLGVYKNTGPNAVETLFTTAQLPQGYLALHPDSTANGSAYSVVRFTAPTTGSYRVTFGFFGLDTDVNTNISGVGVFLNGYGGTGIVNSVYTTGPGAGPGGTNPLLLMNQGDYLDFAVGNGGDDYSFDSTGFQASIVATPEPSTWMMMIIGAGALVTLMRRKSQAQQTEAATAPGALTLA